jgi:hypothetical protein
MFGELKKGNKLRSLVLSKHNYFTHLSGQNGVFKYKIITISLPNFYLKN